MTTATHSTSNLQPDPIFRHVAVRVLLIVEGINDVEFLLRISRHLHVDDPSLPDLGALERAGEVIFLPFGGGQLAAWADRLAPLGIPEIYLVDREVPPETEIRQRAVATLNRRQKCHAFLTAKRSIENYLHREAILSALGINVAYGEFDPVADLVAQAVHQQFSVAPTWEALSRRAHRRLANHAKRRLNTLAVEQMTVALLHERDPIGEIRGWLQSVALLAASS